MRKVVAASKFKIMLAYKKTILSLSLLTIFFSCFCEEPDCELIGYHAIYTVTGNKLVIEESKVLQINKRMGDKYATIKIPYTKRYNVSVEQAQIENMQGVVTRKLKRSDIKDYSNITDFSLYQDHFIKEFELKHNQYPYRISYTTKTVLNEFQEIAQWYPFINNKVPTQKATLELRIPINYKIKYKAFLIPEPSIDTVDKTLVYKFEANNITLPQSEYYSPPMERYEPFVRIVPVEFTWVNSGSHISWKDYGNWIYSLYKGADILPVHEKAQVKKIIQGKTNNIEIVKALYKYMQSKTRYINVTIGVGGLKPYPAEYVSKNGYGDCKALTVYMNALLNEAGIPAYYATIYADDDIPMFMHNFPCHQFNHIITCIPMEKDTLFLENTDNTIPPGYLGSASQGREAFFIGPNISQIIRTPEFKPNDVKETRNFTFRISPENNSLSIDNSLRGYSFDLFNSLHTNWDKTNAEVFLRERVIKGNFSFEIIDWDLTKPHSDSAKINFYANLKLQNYLKSYGPDYGMALPDIGIPIFEQPESRKLPLYFGTPIYKSDSIIYNLSPSFKLKVLTNDAHFKSKYGEYSLALQVSGNTLIITRSFFIPKGEYPLTEYPEFYKFITEISKTDRKLIILSKNL